MRYGTVRLSTFLNSRYWTLQFGEGASKRDVCASCHADSLHGLTACGVCQGYVHSDCLVLLNELRPPYYACRDCIEGDD